MSDLLESVRGALADRYRVEGLLGEGGMAIVYKAQDLKHDRAVAVKVLRPELAAALAVLARAALVAPTGRQSGVLADSARRVLSVTPITAEVDAQGDLHLIEAFALVLLGDHEAAFRALRQWHAVTQETVDLRDTNWWFQPLADDPRYADIARPAR